MQVEEIPIELLVPEESNPNEQDDRTFNALVESIEEEGWLEPIQVVPEDGRYLIVGGHHRAKAAEVLGMKFVPSIVLDPEKFDKDRREWNMVKLNMLKGKLNPEKFAKLYDRMAEKYDKEVLKTLMGFTNDDAFRKLYKEVKDALPEGMREQLDKVADEIKTIDDLSLVLNRLFRDHGETLDSNMMVFSWGGKEVLWVRCSDRLWKRVRRLADEVAETGGDMAEELSRLLEQEELAGTT